MRHSTLSAAFLGAAAVVLCVGNAPAAEKAKDLKVGRSYIVVTSNGKVQSGKLSKQDKQSITLETSAVNSVKILRKDIEAIREAPAKAKQTKKARLRVLQLAAQQQRILQVQRGGANTPVRDADAKDPVERILVFSPRGPLVVELAIYVDGKPFRMAREKIVDELMKIAAEGDTDEEGKGTWMAALQNPRFSMNRSTNNYASYARSYLNTYDVDKNGYIDAKDIKKLGVRGRTVQAQFKQWDANSDGKVYAKEIDKYYQARTEGQRRATANRYDLNKNKLVERYEVRAYLARFAGGAAFNISRSYNYQTEPDIAKILDTNKDGSLTKDELEAAAERLKSRDADDNDLLTSAELGGGNARNPRQRRRPQGGVRLPTAGRRVHLLGPTAQLSALYTELQKQYGDSKKVIAKKAFRAAPELFAPLDLNKNGVLDAGEMVAFHLVKPQLKLEVRLGKDEKRGIGVSVISAAKGLKVRGKLGTMAERTSVSLPGWRFAIDVSNTTARSVNYSRTAQYNITRYDTDKNGYIDAKDIKKLGNLGRTAERYFKQWDANGDGKVYAKEIVKYYDRLQAPQRTQVSLSSTSTGPSLFSAIDETGDKRISLREMRTAAKRLLKLDRNKDGRIDVDEMPSNASITIYRGRTNYAYSRNRGTAATRTPVRGPKWFVHMDKNADGDITLREFLGTKEQFKKLDKNGDGFIELSEAEAVRK